MEDGKMGRWEDEAIWKIYDLGAEKGMHHGLLG